MRFLFPCTVFFISSVTVIFGAQHTFILHDVDSEQFLIQEGDISTRRSPYCTFNILLSLTGFNTKTLQDAENPTWPFKDEYESENKTWKESFPESWKAHHSPMSWMKNSCIWYSQALTRKLGMKTLSDYVIECGYGNQNLEGDAGAANGLTNAWIGSSLRISPLEQVLFVSRLLRKELPVSDDAYEYTKAILFVEELSNGMKLYGKISAGNYANGRQEPEMQIRWFVGWAERRHRRLAFAYMIQGTENDESIPGIAAREELKQRLLESSLN